MKPGILTTTLLAYLLGPMPLQGAAPETLQIMLQGTSAAEIRALVEKNGGTITHDLHIINAVGAKLTRGQLDDVLESPLIARHIDDLSVSELPNEEPDKDKEACKVTGHLELDFDQAGFRWTLYNKRPTPASLESLELAWPAALGTIEKISIGGAALDPALYRDAANNFLEINFPSSASPVLKDKADLQVSFKSSTPVATDLSLRQRDFTVKADFTGGCSTKLIPGYENNHENFYYSSVAGADALHHQGITGKGVTVAILDSGLWEHEALATDTAGKQRLIIKYNALTNTTGDNVLDESGHGTHMASIIAHSGPVTHERKPTGTYKGISPDVNLVAVKVLDREGRAHLLDIIRAIQWIVDNRKKYNIQVLNLSFAQAPSWPYWEDPVNQATMIAWASGITVVAAAGNEGPDPMTIGSPGNLPYIITVGIVTDSWTPNTRDDDYIPDFSSRGPTPSGHIKPDIVAPGGHITGITRPGSALTLDQPEDVLKTGEFASTGSSQASALVSGIVALLLQLEPDLSPDDIKCKLISSAEPAINLDGLMAYSPFQQGYGYVNATRAVTLGQRGCGNPDIDIQSDIDGSEHYEGPAIADDDGNISLPGLQHMVSTEPSEKGLSKVRKWGAKDHVERLNLLPSDTPPSKEPPFDWLEIYMLEKAAIENLAREAP